MEMFPFTPSQRVNNRPPLIKLPRIFSHHIFWVGRVENKKSPTAVFLQKLKKKKIVQNFKIFSQFIFLAALFMFGWQCNVTDN